MLATEIRFSLHDGTVIFLSDLQAEALYVELWSLVGSEPGCAARGIVCHASPQAGRFLAPQFVRRAREPCRGAGVAAGRLLLSHEGGRARSARSVVAGAELKETECRSEPLDAT